MAAISRLRHTSDVRDVLTNGAVVHGRAVVVHARTRNDAGPARWTVVAGRKVGGAVVRNRAKRRLREALRAERLPRGFDLVAVARPAAVDVPFAELRAELARLLARAVVGAPEGGAARPWTAVAR